MLLITALAAMGIMRAAPQPRPLDRQPPSALPFAPPEREILSAIDEYLAGNIERSEAEAQFSERLGAEQRSVTEPTLAALVSQIGRGGVEFFRATRKSQREALGTALRSRLEHLSAEKRGDKRWPGLPKPDELAALGVGALAILILFSAAFSIGRTSVRRPLEELIKGLKEIGDKSAAMAIAAPRTAEWAMFAGELDAMVGRLNLARAKLLNELEGERAAAAAIVRSSEDGFVVLNGNGTLVQINELARTILNLDPQGLIGSDFSELAVESRRVHQLLDRARFLSS